MQTWFLGYLFSKYSVHPYCVPSVCVAPCCRLGEILPAGRTSKRGMCSVGTEERTGGLDLKQGNGTCMQTWGLTSFVVVNSREAAPRLFLGCRVQSEHTWESVCVIQVPEKRTQMAPCAPLDLRSLHF